MRSGLYLILSLIIVILSISSCTTDATDVFSGDGDIIALDDNGLTPSINSFLPDSILQEMISLGMPINTGDKPPLLEGMYLANPLKLLASNIASDYVGQSFVDYTYNFHGQNHNNLTINVDYESSIDDAVGVGSYIVGSDNDFTIFVQALSTHPNGSQANFVYVLSGRLSNRGIEDLNLALFMIDNQGNSGGVWIENGQGRVINDADLISEKI